MTPIIRNITGKGITIPPTVLNLSDFAPTDQLALHVLDNTLVLIRRKMTAYQLLRTVNQLAHLGSSLLTHLVTLCGTCDGCRSACPFDGPSAASVELPASLREKAGIPDMARLSAVVDEEKGTVTLFAAEAVTELEDLPEDLLNLLFTTDICLGEVEHHLLRDDVIYEA